MMKYFTSELSSKKRKHHPPRRTGKEMAAEFGISQQTLAAIMRHDANAPKPVLDNRNTSNAARWCWYDQAEMRKWWAIRTAPNAEVTGGPLAARPVD